MNVIKDHLWIEADGTSVGVMLDAIGEEVSLFSERSKRVIRPTFKDILSEHEIVVIRNHSLPPHEVKLLTGQHFSHTEPLFWHQDDSDFGDAVVLHKQVNTPARKGETWFGSFAEVQANVNSLRNEFVAKFPELHADEPLSLIKVYTAILENYHLDVDETINQWIRSLKPNACYKHHWGANEAQTTITLTPKDKSSTYSCHARIANSHIDTDAPLAWDFVRF